MSSVDVMLNGAFKYPSRKEIPSLTSFAKILAFQDPPFKLYSILINLT